jgi:hypothetical protein
MMPLLMKESLGTHLFLSYFFHWQQVPVKSGGCRDRATQPIRPNTETSNNLLKGKKLKRALGW